LTKSENCANLAQFRKKFTGILTNEPMILLRSQPVLAQETGLPGEELPILSALSVVYMPRVRGLEALKPSHL
jgi:hypothetical protein